MASCNDIIAGSSTGALKGVSLNERSFVNFNSIRELNPRSDGVDCMCWSGQDETEVLCAQLDRSLKLLRPDAASVETLFKCEGGEGGIRGLHIIDNERIVTAVESGSVKVWDRAGTAQTTLEAGENLCRLRASPTKVQCVATGGRENPLKIWDLTSPDKPTFTAKNVRPNWLELRSPVWVRDVRFLDNNQLVTCTGHHQIRVYDQRSGQRRPVKQLEWSEHPLTSLDVSSNQHQVLAANSVGGMGLFDLRGKGILCGVYKGAGGGIRDLVCHPSAPYVVSCGADRFLRIHDVQTRQLLHKIYCKAPLNCVLMKKNLSILKKQPEEENRKEEESNSEKESDSSDEDLWNEMIQIQDYKKKNKEERKETKRKKEEKRLKKRKRTADEEAPKKKKKPNPSRKRHSALSQDDAEEKRKKSIPNKPTGSPNANSVKKMKIDE